MRVRHVLPLNVGVVASTRAHPTPMPIRQVKLDVRRGRALVALDDDAVVRVLGRHRLCFNLTVVYAVQMIHVAQLLMAQRADVAGSHVTLETLMVHRVTAQGEHDLGHRVVQVALTARAARVQRPLHAPVLLVVLPWRHACVARVAMVIVLADATDATLVAVVEMLVGCVVVEAANLAKIARKEDVTGATVSSHRLLLVAQHALDRLDLLPVAFMILAFVVAQAAHVPSVTTCGLDAATTRIVLASQHASLLVVVGDHARLEPLAHVIPYRAQNRASTRLQDGTDHRALLSIAQSLVRIDLENLISAIPLSRVERPLRGRR